MVDVFVQMPGASAKEVEKARHYSDGETPLGKSRAWSMFYSTKQFRPVHGDSAFYVGQNIEESIVKLYNKLYSNFDKIPAWGKPALDQAALDR